MSRRRFFGHRGARALAPENTLVSFRRAIADGADGVELDLRATRDGAIVLLHDAKLDRTTSGSGPLRFRTLREIRALDAGSWLDPRFAGELVPTLDEVLDELLGRTGLDLEMKELLPADGLRALGDRIGSTFGTGVFASSFHDDVLEQLRDLAPGVPRGLLLDRGVHLPTPGRAKALGLACIVAHEATIDARFADGCRALGLSLHAFTVNAPARAKALAELGVDIVITDDPGSLRDGCDESSGGTGSPRGGA